MRAVAFCLLALVVAASAREFPLAQYRSLLQERTELNCETDSMATLNLQGSGSGFAQATAFCQALADAEKVIKSVVEDYIEVFEGESSKGQCTEAKASEAVTGVAKAIASAYTSVTTKVEITGTGQACASGFAAGDSLAVSLVNVYLRVSVELIEKKYPTKSYGQDVKKAVDEKVDSATGEASGSAVAAAIAKAWAAATGEACTTGGFKSDFQEAFVKSTTTAVAELWATVIVELCSNFDDAKKDELKEWAEKTSKSFSEIAGDVSVEGVVEQSTTEGGAASGVAGEIPVCGATRGICCSANNKGQDNCSCGPGCSMKKGSGGQGTQIVWEDDNSGETCFCA
ncbi:unnamed protein product [Ostreobium quekettii]|uniref:Uncharacterized protein n=1 Tax=Ostreobium quekettii TaxID=121088 RepID=A0A8S1J4J4_9CHLO|nr:unnamed protein product [Ostreobium quekettii]